MRLLLPPSEAGAFRGISQYCAFRAVLSRKMKECASAKEPKKLPRPTVDGPSRRQADVKGKDITAVIPVLCKSSITVSRRLNTSCADSSFRTRKEARTWLGRPRKNNILEYQISRRIESVRCSADKNRTTRSGHGAGLQAATRRPHSSHRPCRRTPGHLCDYASTTFETHTDQPDQAHNKSSTRVSTGWPSISCSQQHRSGCGVQRNECTVDPTHAGNFAFWWERPHFIGPTCQSIARISQTWWERHPTQWLLTSHIRPFLHQPPQATATTAWLCVLHRA